MRNAPKKRKNKFKRKKKPKERYQLTYWTDYTQALIKRVRLQLWLDQQTLQNWYYSGQHYRGAYRYSGAR